MRAEFTAAGFEDQDKAEFNVAQIEARLAPSLLAPLASLLRESPDADGALDWLARYAGSAPPDVLAGLAHHPTALTYLIAIFGTSGFLAETLVAEPGLVVQFARDRNFSKLKSKEDLLQDFARFTTINPDHWLSAQLARFKRRHTLRIALKDVLGLATLGETVLELSALADVILNEALVFCDLELAKRYGHPQYRDAEGRIAESGFAVISLGKLGGQELSYSSDIELMFVFSAEGETSGGSESESAISNKEYFVRLAQAVTRTVTQKTPQGEIFRADVGGRPDGDEGELAISLASALAYYEHRAGDGELQALIRARHSAGDAHLSREFLRAVERFIYGRAARQDAPERDRASAPRHSSQSRAAPEDPPDVEIERGGIRDIEFLAQSLQRLHGCSDPWVRGGGTLRGLRKLNDKGWISDADYAGLTAAYGFLSQVEHRMQLESGQENHHLPNRPEPLRRVGCRVGLDGDETGDKGNRLVQEIRNVFQRVEGIYLRLSHSEGARRAQAEFDLMPPPVWTADLGHHSFESLLDVLDAHVPDLADLVRQCDFPAHSRPNVTRLLTALFSSAELYRLARENPSLVGRALEAVAVSDYLAGLLADRPEEIVSLDSFDGSDAIRGAVSVRTASYQLEMPMEQEAWPKPFARAVEPGITPSDRMALLRSEFRARAIALAAADVSGLSSIFPALARWSALAAQAVVTASAIAQESLPGASKADVDALPIAVLALGRLGQNEFDLASVAELVFVAETSRLQKQAELAHELCSMTVGLLSSYTREGAALAVDLRLRPGGKGGELAVADDALLDFLEHSAGFWEVMAYSKALPIAGHDEFASRVAKRIGDACLRRFKGDPGIRLWSSRRAGLLEVQKSGSPFNSGTVPGCYEALGFAVAYLRLRHQIPIPPGANISRQIEACRSRGRLTASDAEVLDHAAAFLLSVDHAIRLATGKAAENLPEVAGQAEAVETLARRWQLVTEGEPLAARLREVQQLVNEVCRRITGSD